jgi:hypothetical protein
MPYLFCEKHGCEHEADVIAAQDAYRQDGESVVMVKGTLISGPWQCDRGICGAPLRKGMRAYLATAYPGSTAERTHEIDFASERCLHQPFDSLCHAIGWQFSRNLFESFVWVC